MLDINIGMKRAEMRKLGERLVHVCDEAEAAADGRRVPTAETVAYGVTNDARKREVTITINNEDMDRSDVPDDAIYVDVEES